MPAQPLDSNYKPITNDLYDPTGLQFVSQQAATVYTASDGTKYAAGAAVVTGAGTPTIIQKAKAASTGSVASLGATFTGANVAGNSIIVVCGAGSNGTLTVTDSAGNTYTSAVSGANSTTFEAQIFYAVGIAANSANTVTVATTSSSSLAVQVYEVSGLIAQVGALGQSSSGNGTGTTGSTSNLSASVPNSLIFLGVAVGTTAEAITAVTGTNWTVDSSQNTTTPSGLFSFGSLSLALDNVGPIIPQATIAASKPWAAVSAIFKPVVLGVQGTVTIGGYNYTRVTTAATTQVKTGPGILHAIVVNKPTSTATIEADDALSNTSPVIGILGAFAASIAPFTVVYDVAFTTGLSVTVGVATVDATIVWK